MHWGSGVARVSAGLSGDKARSTSRGGNGVALHRMSSDIQSTSMDGRAPSSMVARSGIDQGHLLQNLAAGRETRAGFATNAAASPAQGQAQQTLQTAAGGSPSAGQQTVQLPCAHITEQLQTTAGREQQGASPGGNSFAAAGQGSREAAKAPASSPGACHAAAPAAKPPAGPIARPVHASSTASSDTIGGGGGERVAQASRCRSAACQRAATAAAACTRSRHHCWPRTRKRSCLSGCKRWKSKWLL